VTQVVDLASLLGGQQDPELARQTELLALRGRQLEEQSRRDVLRFAAVLCGCARRYSWDDPRPPQVGCIVHGSMMLGPDGRIVC